MPETVQPADSPPIVKADSLKGLDRPAVLSTAHALYDRLAQAGDAVIKSPAQDRQEEEYLKRQVKSKNGKLDLKGHHNIALNDPDKLWLATNIFYPKKEAETAYYIIQAAQIASLGGSVGNMDAQKIHQELTRQPGILTHLNQRQFLYGENAILRLLNEQLNPLMVNPVAESTIVVEPPLEEVILSSDQIQTPDKAGTGSLLTDDERRQNEIIERYSAKAKELMIKPLEGGDWMAVDGTVWKQMFSEGETNIPLRTDPSEVADRMEHLGEYVGNDGVFTVIDSQGSMHVGVQTGQNREALEKAGYKRCLHESRIFNFNADYYPADPDKEAEYRELEEKGRKQKAENTTQIPISEPQLGEFNPDDIKISGEAPTEDVYQLNLTETGNSLGDTLDVYIKKDVLGDLKKDLTERGSKLEGGGVLVGHIIIDPKTQKLSTRVTHYIPSLRGEPGPTTFRFTADAWSEANDATDNLKVQLGDPTLRIVGWVHSHPGFGIFLSGDDNFVNKFFQEPGQVAMVFDPIRDQLGVFSKGGSGQEFGESYRQHGSVFITSPK